MRLRLRLPELRPDEYRYRWPVRMGVAGGVLSCTNATLMRLGIRPACGGSTVLQVRAVWAQFPLPSDRGRAALSLAAVAGNPGHAVRAGALPRIH